MQFCQFLVQQCQVRVTAQGVGVLSMTVGQRVSAVSLDIIHDAYGLVFVGHELVTLPLAYEQLLWPAGCVKEHVFAWCIQSVGFLPSPWCCILS